MNDADRLYLWTRRQWMRVAEYWQATRGALPAPVLQESQQVVDHWIEHHLADPPERTELVDQDGRTLEYRFASALTQWVNRLFAHAALESVPMRRWPSEWEREAEMMQRAARLWH